MAAATAGLAVGERARLGVARALQQQQQQQQLPSDATDARPPSKKPCVQGDEYVAMENVVEGGEGQDCCSSSAAGASRLRCVYPGCPAAAGRYPGWADCGGVIRHINRVHLPSHGPPPPDFLAAFRLDICVRCKVLYFTRAGCKSCKHRPGLAQPPTVVRSEAAPQEPAVHDPQAGPLPGQAQAAAAPTLTLDQVLRDQIPTLTHVPKGFRIQWCSALSRAIRAFCQDPCPGTMLQVWALPKALLFPLARGGARRPDRPVKELMQRLQLWERGEMDQLWALAKARCGKKAYKEPPLSEEERLALEVEFGESDETWRQRVLRPAREGNISRAAAALTSEAKLLNVTPEVEKQLQELHPSPKGEFQVSDPPPPPPDDLWDTDDIHKALKSFPQYSAPGPSGLRAAHITEALTCGAAGPADLLEEGLENFVGACATGDFPTALAPYLSAARLIPLSKKGGGVRPIAVGEVFRRLVGKVLIRAAQQEVVDSYLFPLQLGVGVKSATELISRAAGFFMARGVPLIQVDLKNAYNSVSRSLMLQRVREKAPAFAAWAELTYGQPAPLVVNDSVMLLSREGVQQGDPLGPLFFALASFSMVEKLSKVPNLLWSGWYLEGICTRSRRVLRSFSAKDPAWA